MRKEKRRPDEELQRATELYAKFFQGLAHPARLRIVEVLLEKACTVSELMERLGLPQSQVSNHLACLKWCGYVSSRQEGRYMVYFVTDVRVRAMIELAKGIVADNAARLSRCTRI
ncbi:ArsR/SmtB family transcription factor [Calditerricola satsumensis]|uniref:HTH arsR-type domain-containing protein n=1 Tax=Calditerricola satsumensis TaxID=373054 RepID=A0A8J3BAI2_9BACI|nr:metalloregulator ArsR/SmtB family transcription factor [Calditerricola satsumensis]GGJ92009.1 hypothetical protein GCM10007043_02150 [Calditerricola satsumensis]